MNDTRYQPGRFKRERRTFNTNIIVICEKNLVEYSGNTHKNVLLFFFSHVLNISVSTLGPKISFALSIYFIEMHINSPTVFAGSVTAE